MDKKYLELVRPNVGQPLLLTTNDLEEFEVTIAYRDPEWDAGSWINEGITKQFLHNILQEERISIIQNTQTYQLKVNRVATCKLYKKFEANIPAGKLPQHPDQYKYTAGYVWECRVKVGLSKQQRDELTAPVMMDLKFRNRTNYNAVYVDDHLHSDGKFSLIHLTDLHIARRNDKIPEIICQTRSASECQQLTRDYVNFNDNFRAVIKHANKMIHQGKRVIMVITGDLMDYWYDGFVDEVTYCGYVWNEGDDTKKRQVLNSRGGYWNGSNMAAFHDVLLGLDKLGEKPLFPVFTILGNHDFGIHEPPLTFKIDIDVGPISVPIQDKEDINAFGLSKHRRAATEYDYWAMQARVKKVRGEWAYVNPSPAERKPIKDGYNEYVGDLPHFRSCIIGRPDISAMSYYHTLVNFDTDYTFAIRNHQFVCLNTGEDIYGPCELSESGVMTTANRMIRGLKEGRSRGFTGHHVNLVREALSKIDNENGVLFLFSHGCFVGVSDDLEREIRDKHLKESQSHRPFRVGERNDQVVIKFQLFDIDIKCDDISHACGEGKHNQLFELLTSQSAVDKPIMAMSGHTHGVREIRVRATSEDHCLAFFIDDYTNNKKIKNWSEWLRQKGPLFVTSGGCLGYKSEPELEAKPGFREICVEDDTIVKMGMHQLEKPKPTAKFDPGVRRVQIRCKAGIGSGSFMYAPENSNDITMPYPEAVYNKPGTHFELIKLDDDKVALRAHNGNYVRAKDGGGGKLAADQKHIKSHETFRLIHRSETGNLVAFQANNGRFLRATRDCEVLADSQHIDSWAEFRLSDL